MLSWCHPFLVTSCNFTESNLHSVNFHATLFNEHGIYRPLRSQFPNLMSIFLCGDVSKKSVHIPTPCITPRAYRTFTDTYYSLVQLPS
jgi:hypothetical protein